MLELTADICTHRRPTSGSFMLGSSQLQEFEVLGASNSDFRSFVFQQFRELRKWLHAFEPGTARAQEWPQHRSPKPPR
eukprot:14393615-Alexandrium_andersonii.AAC.1